MEPLRPVKLRDPVPPAVDCGRDEQNEHLRSRAWQDQEQRVSTTYLLDHFGAVAGYVTVCMDSLPLTRRERGLAIRYKYVSALKLAQLGIDLRFQGRGLGTRAVGIVTRLAQRVGEQVGCRYLTVDAQRDLVPWYEAIGFKHNELRQQQRIAEALQHRRDPEAIPVSMRLDLREPGQ
jgi:GNAT superfamily N-acetyltransferase